MSILKYFQSVSQTEDSQALNSQATSDCVQELPPISTITAESTELDGGGDSSLGGCTPPSPKKPRTDSVPKSHDLARYIGRPMCLSDAEKHELLTNPLRPGVFNIVGCNCILGWHTVSKKMVDSALLAFYLLHLDTMGLTPVSLSNVP